MSNGCAPEVGWMVDDFLQGVIRKVHDDPDLLVVSSRTERLSSKGDNYTSSIFRILVTAKKVRDGKTQTISLAMKIPPESEVMSDLVSKTSLFLIEMKMFSETLPKFSKLFREKTGENFNIGADFYYQKLAFPYALILEDLKYKGFKMAQRHKGLDIDHCELVIKSLAKFHAASVTQHSIFPEDIECYSTNFYFEEDTSSLMNTSITSTLSVLIPLLEEWGGEWIKYAGKLRNVGGFLDRMRGEMKFNPSCACNVLIHGDLWINNMLFKYDDETGDVREVKFLDFQLSYYTSAAIDLQYFIYTSSTEEVKSTQVERLLKTYHSEFCNTLKILGYDKAPISFAQLLKEFEGKNFIGLFVALFYTPIMFSEVEDTMDLDALAKNSEDATSQSNRIRGKRYTDMIKRLLPFFEEKGVL